jgi:hypothetical protein
VLQRVAEAGGISSANTQSPVDASPSISSQQHHCIATNWSNPVNIFAFIQAHDGDPAVKIEVILKRVHILHFSCFLSEFHTKAQGSHPFPAAEVRH